MKKTFAIFATLCIVTLSACFSPWTGGDEGTITINFSAAGSAGRIAVTPDEINSLTHSVTMTGPGGVIIEEYFTGSDSATFVVGHGTWAIDIRAVGDTPARYNEGLSENYRFPMRILRAVGSGQAEVTAGRNADANIAMISTMEVANYAQLSSVILNARADGREKIIMIMGNIRAEGTYSIETATRNITLASDMDITITRSSGNRGFMFDVTGTGNTLTFGRPGMGGSITIDGYGDDVTAAIIGVSRDAEFVMNQGVTLTQNRRTGSGSNGGAVEVGEGGRFTMNGGVISNNSAERGGGVHVGSNGAFTMSGGIIYGADRPSTRNSAVLGGASLFVESGGTAMYAGAYAATFGDNISTTNRTLPHETIPGTGVLDLTINLADFEDMSPDVPISVSIGYLALQDDYTVDITLDSDVVFQNVRWLLNGIEIDETADEKAISLCNFILVGIGTHFLTVEVDILRNDILVPYSRVVEIRVTL